MIETARKPIVVPSTLPHGPMEKAPHGVIAIPEAGGGAPGPKREPIQVPGSTHPTTPPSSVPPIGVQSGMQQIGVEPGLAHGDVVLTVLTYRAHTLRVVKRTDPAQYIPYFDTCSCGYQARLYDEATARSVAKGHIDWVTIHPTHL